jgi:hypothetical protein
MCSLVENEQCFRSAYCLKHQSDEYATHEEVGEDIGAGSTNG